MGSISKYVWNALDPKHRWKNIGLLNPENMGHNPPKPIVYPQNEANMWVPMVNIPYNDMALALGLFLATGAILRWWSMCEVWTTTPRKWSGAPQRESNQGGKYPSHEENPGLTFHEIVVNCSISKAI